MTYSQLTRRGWILGLFMMLLSLAPAVFAGCNESGSTLIERHRLRGREPRLRTRGQPRLDGVGAEQILLPARSSSIARFGQAHGMHRPQPHLPRAAIHREAEDPAASRAVNAIGDVQPQTGAVAMHAGPSLCGDRYQIAGKIKCEL